MQPHQPGGRIQQQTPPSSNGIASRSPPSSSAPIAPSASSSSLSSTPPSSAVPSAKNFGDFKVEKVVIGKGSFAKVYKGSRISDQTPVAVKVVDTTKLSTRLLENLNQEIEILTAIKHVNIVTCYDVVKSSRQFLIFLEFLAGGDFAAYLKKNAPLSEQQAAVFMKQIASGMKFLNDRRMVHRDLKPSNLLLSHESGRAEDIVMKLADFGFARVLGHEVDMMATLCGSPLYMAPEILNHQQYDVKADLWSIGVIFFEMLFKQLPFMAENPPALAETIRKNKVRIPSRGTILSPQCVDLLLRLLTPDPQQRISFAEFFSHPFFALHNLGGFEPMPSSPPQPVASISSSASSPAISSISASSSPSHPQRIPNSVSVPAGVSSAASSPVLQPPGSQASNQFQQLPAYSSPLTPPGSITPPRFNPPPSMSGSSSSSSSATTPVGKPPLAPAASLPPFSSSPSAPSFMPQTYSSSPNSNQAIRPPKTNPFKSSGSPTIPSRMSASEAEYVIVDKSDSGSVHASSFSSQQQQQQPGATFAFPPHVHVFPQFSRMDISDPARLEYVAVICDFSQLQCDAASIPHLDRLETTAKIVWAIAECAESKIRLQQELEALSLCHKILDMLSSCYPAMESLPSSPRLIAIQKWIADLYDHMLSKTEILIEQVDRQAILPRSDNILYMYLRSLSHDAAIEEMAGDIDSSCVFYGRSQLILQQLLTEEHLEKTHLQQFAVEIDKRLDKMKRKEKGVA